ncbi:MAG: RraA family protein [Actinobacteria bacterium]|nr:MAG: RraA family protein [Actinomycetota bacterium]
MKDQIIDYIRRNRVSTTEVADCLDKTGVIPGVHALNRGHFRVGPVHWAYADGESNWACHEGLRDVAEGAVVVVDAFDCGERAIFGDLVTKFLVLYRQAEAVVVVGNMRDAARLIRENYPVWCAGTNPVGCFNTADRPLADPSLVAERRAYLEGAIAVCDDTGVVIIPKERYDAEFLGRLEAIEEQEDIWYECIDRRKWDTYDTVCLKKYLED